MPLGSGKGFHHAMRHAWCDGVRVSMTLRSSEGFYLPAAASFTSARVVYEKPPRDLYQSITPMTTASGEMLQREYRSQAET